jgi:NADP-dependent aldehyde dehydrogenase
MTTLEELRALTAAAAAAARRAATATMEERAGWLRAIADRLDDHSEELVEIGVRETRLPTARLTGEVLRTTTQLRMFADVALDGGYLEAVIDHADPSATPPSPDLRRMLIPLGPVAVFSASNFPFAFSVAGGDTASALAAGCPVIVKAHSGHLDLSTRSAELVQEALRDAGAPEGLFALVTGRDAGNALVADPNITAVGFTGSVSGGRALFDIASGRPDPIPFFGELGSVNPVVLTRRAVERRADALAEGLTGSFTLGVGQFCTKPGVVFVPAGSGFEDRIAPVVAAASGGPLLTDRIADSFPEGLAALAADSSVRVLAGTAEQHGAGTDAQPVVFATAEAARANPGTLLEECFGPATLLIAYSSDDDLLETLRAVPGSLTATVHSEAEDDLTELLEVVTGRAGRIVFDGWPTGVAVTWSQHHGGPWPATTSQHTSVGATAIRRFLRPVAFQNAPERVLPDALREDNPLGIPRRVDGALQAGSTPRGSH